MHTNSYGQVIWLFGLSGAGKTTLACKLGSQWRLLSGICPLMLDGDRLRAGLCRDLGHSDDGRQESLRRAAEVARVAIESGINVVAAFMTPRESQRRLVRDIIGSTHVALVHVYAPLEVCRIRDPKGLYSLADRGLLRNLPGVDAPFETPVLRDCVVNTERAELEKSFAELCEFAKGRFVTSPARTGLEP